MSKLTEDMSVLTTIPDHTLKKLLEKAKLSICHSLLESYLAGDEDIKADIGIGNLVIKVSEDSIKYRFVPYPTFEEAVQDTITNKCSPLNQALEDAITSRLEKVYKELF